MSFQENTRRCSNIPLLDKVAVLILVEVVIVIVFGGMCRII
jgi:hypothetical protein